MKVRRFRNRGQKKKWIRNLWYKLFSGKGKKKIAWKRIIGIPSAIVFLIVFLYGSFFLPSVEDADQLSFAESTIIYDRGALDPTEDPNDHILYIVHGDENREYVPLDEIPKHVTDATLAIEDDGFYRHFGFDIGAIVKAAVSIPCAL